MSATRTPGAIGAWSSTYATAPGQRLLIFGNHDVDHTEALQQAGFAEQCTAALFATEPPLALTHISNCRHGRHDRGWLNPRRERNDPEGGTGRHLTMRSVQAARSSLTALQTQWSQVPGDIARRSSGRSCGGMAGNRCTKCRTALSGRTSTQECQMALSPGTPTGRARPFAETTSLRVPMRRR